jgi:hypothetical protein
MSYASPSRKFDSHAYINMVTAKNKEDENAGEIKKDT